MRDGVTHLSLEGWAFITAKHTGFGLRHHSGRLWSYIFIPKTNTYISMKEETLTTNMFKTNQCLIPAHAWPRTCYITKAGLEPWSSSLKLWSASVIHVSLFHRAHANLCIVPFQVSATTAFLFTTRFSLASFSLQRNLKVRITHRWVSIYGVRGMYLVSASFMDGLSMRAGCQGKWPMNDSRAEIFFSTQPSTSTEELGW